MLILTVSLAIACGSDTATEDSDESAVAIAGYEVQPRDLSRIVRSSARIEAENYITIASRMSGLITGLNAREGDRFSDGDILLEFDTEEQEAELDRARAQLDLATAVYERSRTLYDREAISTAEYEETRADKRIAESEVKLLETRIRFGTVRAPTILLFFQDMLNRVMPFPIMSLCFVSPIWIGL
ncbi:MAG: biotin/lipoyl-binding protein [Balneolaceae bacterium]|nr:biotin/lipoyl-binding protein [Balneolaceae bacterium]MCH8549599.1 biotin/lipoyl-binding protein [Balneolaceae bacterium]